MKANTVLLSLLAASIFAGCGADPVPPITNISNNEKKIMTFDLPADKVQGDPEAFISDLFVKGLNATTQGCNRDKNDKHLIFDIYYKYRCQITHGYEKGFLKRTLKTVKRTTRKSIGAGTSVYYDKPSFMTLYAPIHIAKNDKGYHIDIDGVNKVVSKMPGDIEHFYTPKQFTEQFNGDLYAVPKE